MAGVDGIITDYPNRLRAVVAEAAEARTRAAPPSLPPDPLTGGGGDAEFRRR